MYYSEKVEYLKGKTIKEILVEDDRETLMFILDPQEKIEFQAVGDCCSDSWIEHYDHIKEPATIIEFVEIDIPASFESKPSEHNKGEDVMEYYFYELKTDKGSFMIEMRNSSNGYYGGSLV